MKYIFKAFRAVDYKELSLEYFNGHAQVLRDFGIESLTSSQDEWLTNPNVIVISAYNENGKIVGGVKLHLFHEKYPLPVESAINYLDDRITSEILKLADKGTGEACGLWIAKEMAGKNFGLYLTRSAIAITDQFSLSTLLGFSSPHTFKMFSSLGYVPLKSVGDNGNFLYPNENYTSTVIIIPNTSSLEHASPENRKRSFELRKKLFQEFCESENEGVVIEYNLSLLSLV